MGEFSKKHIFIIDFARRGITAFLCFSYLHEYNLDNRINIIY